MLVDLMSATGTSTAAKAFLGGAVVFLIAGVALTPLWAEWSGDSDTEAGFGVGFLSLAFGVVAAAVATILRGMGVVIPRRRVLLIA